MKKLFLFASVAALLGGCSKDTTEDAAAPVTGRSAIYATYDDGSDATRTVAQPDGNNGYYLYWELGDAIGVFDAEAGDSTNEYFAYTGSDGVFLGDKGFLFGEGYVAYYPYKENRSISATGEITLNIPAEQKYRTNAGEAGSFAQNVAPAVAYGKATTDDKLHLTFRPVATYMRVPIIGEGTVKTLELRIKRDGEYIGLAGDVKLNIADIIKDVTSVAPATGDYTETAITLVCHKDGKGGVVLDPSEPKYFWFVIPGGLTWQHETVEFTVNDAPNKLTRTLDYASPKTTKVNGAIVMGQGSTVDASGKSVAVPFEWIEGAIPDAEQAFPDPIFREYVLANFDTDHDGKISEAEALKVTRIDVPGMGIESLEGVQYFVNLHEIDWTDNPLEFINLGDALPATFDGYGVPTWSGSLGSERLKIVSSRITELKVTGNKMLQSLDVSECPALEVLRCYGNSLTSIDLSHNTALTDLYWHDNPFYEIILGDINPTYYNQSLKATMYPNFSGTLKSSTNLRVVSSRMTGLNVSGNKLITLDVSECPALQYLNCSSNQLTTLDVSKTNLGNSTASIPLRCSDMETLQTLILKSGWDLALFDYPYQTEIIYIDDNGNIIESGVTNRLADPVFRDYVLKTFDTDGDGKISRDEVAAVTRIQVSNDEIISLEGIRLFLNLNELSFSSNQLTTLDLSQNTKLTTLDVSGCPALTELDCGYNPLELLNLGDVNPTRYYNSLYYYYYDYPNLSGSLGFSTKLKVISSKITRLNVGNNSLQSLDISECPALTELNCGYNQLTTLDVSKNTALTSLSCSSNQLATLDVSKNTALTSLSCSSNQLATLDVSKNTALTSLHCDSNQLATLDVSKNTALTSLYCDSNQLTTLDVSKNTVLTYLNCRCNPLESLNLGDIDVTSLSLSEDYYSNNNGLTSTTFKVISSKLTSLDVSWNQLQSLDVSGCPALTELNCGYNQLATLDVSKNTALTRFYCENNPLELLNLGDANFTSLSLSKDYYSGNNYLTSTTFKVISSKLTSLDVSWNQLQSLDVSKCPALTDLSCHDNKLTTLDVSHNTALTSLDCSSNQLTTLNVSGCTALTSLDCPSNQLTTLDASGCPIRYLDCWDNPLETLYLKASGNKGMRLPDQTEIIYVD